jgi:hydrogenase maturation protein HypF
MWLEAIATDALAPPLPLSRNAAGIWQTDWTPLLGALLDDETSLAERAGMFHASLAMAILEQAQNVRAARGGFTVGLSGGVFQNRRLTEPAVALLRQDGFDVRLAERVPVNDAGLSFGQIIEAASRT